MTEGKKGVTLLARPSHISHNKKLHLDYSVAFTNLSPYCPPKPLDASNE